MWFQIASDTTSHVLVRLLTFKSDIKVCSEKVSECMSSSFEVGDYESDLSLVVTGWLSNAKWCERLRNQLGIGLQAIWRLFLLLWLATLLLWVLLVASVLWSGLCPCSLLLARLFNMRFGLLVTALIVHAMANITLFNHVGRFYLLGICQLYFVGPSNKLENIHLFFI